MSDGDGMKTYRDAAATLLERWAKELREGAGQVVDYRRSTLRETRTLMK